MEGIKAHFRVFHAGSVLVFGRRALGGEQEVFADGRAQEHLRFGRGRLSRPTRSSVKQEDARNGIPKSSREAGRVENHGFLEKEEREGNHKDECFARPHHLPRTRVRTTLCRKIKMGESKGVNCFAAWN